jgi:DNA-binding response OmpR family regulator
MRKPPTSETSLSRVLSVLSVSPIDQDHVPLESILGHTRWMLFKADSLSAARSVLQQHEISVVLCERDLQPGSWIDVLNHIKILPKVPSLIVTSRLADDHLWSEALNLGAWDVLAKPFHPAEVLRCVRSAWHHWDNQIRLPRMTMKAIADAS